MSYSTALERALRAVERAMGKAPQTRRRNRKSLIKGSRSVARKPAKRRMKNTKTPDHTPPRTEPDVAELQESFAPAPTPPGPIAPVYWVPPAFDGTEPGPVLVPSSRPVETDEARIIRLTAEAQAQRPAPAPAPSSSTNARRQCAATDPNLRGRRCLLLEGHGDGHRHERGAFRTAPPREDIDTAAWRGIG